MAAILCAAIEINRCIYSFVTVAAFPWQNAALAFYNVFMTLSAASLSLPILESGL